MFLRYGIRDKSKLIKTAVVLLICIVLFFLYSLPYIHTTPGEIAMAGAIALIIAIGSVITCHSTRNIFILFENRIRQIDILKKSLFKIYEND